MAHPTDDVRGTRGRCSGVAPEGTFEVTLSVRAELEKLLKQEKLVNSQIETILLLIDISEGEVCFETDLQELSKRFFSDYETQRVSVRKNYKSRIRSRIDYFVNERRESGKTQYFTVLSRTCAEPVCAAKHTKRTPNPDVITIRLDFLPKWMKRIRSDSSGNKEKRNGSK